MVLIRGRRNLNLMEPLLNALYQQLSILKAIVSKIWKGTGKQICFRLTWIVQAININVFLGGTKKYISNRSIK